VAATALLISAVAFAFAYRGADAAPGSGTRAIVFYGQLGDNEVCQPDAYLGRITTTGSGHTVGEQISGDGFTIQVTLVDDQGGIRGFTVISGSYSRIVIHAGDGQTTFSDPTGPFDHALSFVAFCGTQVPTETPTDVPPTETATEVPPTETATEVPPTETATEVPTDTGQETEVPPTETATGVPPTETATTVPPTNTPPVQGVDETPVPTVAALPSTGASDTVGGSGPNTLAMLIGALALATAGLALWQRRRTA
jgi:hypothetical protein